MLIERSIELHRQEIEPITGKPVGAYKTDVIALEARLGIRLPLAYQEFLLWMGADFHGVLKGSDCFIDHVEANQEALADLFEENSLPPLPYKPIAFFVHQGYIACWFSPLDQHDDPEVFSFNESMRFSGVRALGTFSEWLYAELSGLAKAIQ